jgi:heavy metal sensor kinase
MRQSPLSLHSLRVRLAVFFAALITVALLVFGGAVYVAAEAIEAEEVEPLEEKQRELLRVRRLLLSALAAGIPVVVLLAAAGSTWMTRRTMQALGEIVRTASEVSPERLGQRLPLGPKDDAELQGLVLALNQMLDRVERAVTGLRRFTSDAAHELRTPLAALMSRLEIALCKPREAEQLRAIMAETLEGLSSLSRLVETLLILARSDSGELHLSLEQIPLSDLLSDVLSLYEGMATERELSLRVDCEPLLSVRSDRLLLHRAVANLVDNACKFSPRGGAITVTAHQPEGGRIEVSVTDSGPGFPESDRERLFERFYRGDLHRGSTEGFGLGLALTREFVSVLGGKVSLRSRKGGGTDASILLPTDRPAQQ